MLSQEALLAQMGDGLLLTSLMGLHAGTNAVSGDFSLSAEGFRIKGGRIDTPVEPKYKSSAISSTSARS